MPTAYITVGLPASGKSTWADYWCAKTGASRVERDIVRKMLKCYPYGTPEQEEKVTYYCSVLVSMAVWNGEDIVISDNNLDSQRVANLIESLPGYTIVMVSFLHVPIETLLERDSKRPNKVGKDVILNRVDKYFYSKGKGYGLAQ